MEIKKWIGILITCLTISCSNKTFTLQELKGTYYEVQNSGDLNPNCTLVVGDSTLTLKDCMLLKDFKGHNIKIQDDVLIYHLHGYYTYFDIYLKNNSIYLHQLLQENIAITFKKVK